MNHVAPVTRGEPLKKMPRTNWKVWAVMDGIGFGGFLFRSDQWNALVEEAHMEPEHHWLMEASISSIFPDSSPCHEVPCSSSRVGSSHRPGLLLISSLAQTLQGLTGVHRFMRI